MPKPFGVELCTKSALLSRHDFCIRLALQLAPFPMPVTSRPEPDHLKMEAVSSSVMGEQNVPSCEV